MTRRELLYWLPSITVEGAEAIRFATGVIELRRRIVYGYIVE